MIFPVLIKFIIRVACSLKILNIIYLRVVDSYYYNTRICLPNVIRNHG